MSDEEEDEFGFDREQIEPIVAKVVHDTLVKEVGVLDRFAAFLFD